MSAKERVTGLERITRFKRASARIDEKYSDTASSKWEPTRDYDRIKLPTLYPDNMFNDMLNMDTTRKAIESIRALWHSIDHGNKDDIVMLIEVIERACINVSPIVRYRLIWLIVALEEVMPE